MRNSQFTYNMWRAHVSSRQTVTEMYDILVQKGVLKNDPKQREMAQACTSLLNYINSPKRTAVEVACASSSTTATSRKFNVMYKKFRDMGSWILHHVTPKSPALDVALRWAENIGTQQKSGIYMWGSVGVGKTVIMDLFELSETPGLTKRRTHLHSFMTDIVLRLHRAHEVANKAHKVSPINCVVDDVLRESPILCLDEFQTFDVAHASLLAAFFSRALPRGLILFTTSNRQPDELTTISTAFEEFLPVLWHHCDVVYCGDIKDYRENASHSYHDVIFLYPNTKENRKRLIRRVERGFKGNNWAWEEGATISLYGRELIVNYQCCGVAVFEFAHICNFFGHSDFQCIARSFHTVVIMNVPHIAAVSKDAAQQFVVLVDELYQYNVKLLFTSEAPWDHIVDVGKVGGDDGDNNIANPYYSEGEDERSGYSAHYQFRNEEEVLSFDRIASRLKEMGCEHYLLRDHCYFLISDYNLAALME